jgi:hypothetical protein
MSKRTQQMLEAMSRADAIERAAHGVPLRPDQIPAQLPAGLDAIARLAQEAISQTGSNKGEPIPDLAGKWIAEQQKDRATRE